MTVVAIGVPGSGKSRYIKRLLAVRLMSPTARVLVYCPHRHDSAQHKNDLFRRGVWYRDGRRLLSDADKGQLPRLTIAYRPDDLDALATAAVQLRPCVLYLDEVIDACTANRWLVEAVRRIWAEHRHDGVDLFLSLHRPAEVPRVVTAHANVTLLFRVEEPRDVRYVGERYGPSYADAVRELDCPTWRPLVYPAAGLDLLGWPR